MRLFSAAIALTVCLAFTHSPVWAQAGWYLIPSFNLTEQFDDNIFGSSSNRQSDLISRFSPGLQGGYRSEPLTIFLLGELTAEVFAKNPDLNNATSGKRAGFTLQYVPDRVITLNFDIGYAETESVTTLGPILSSPGFVSGPGGVTLTPTNPSPTQPTTPTTPSTPGPGGPTQTPTGGTAPPTVINPIVNTVEFGRQKATILFVSPSVKYTLTPLTQATAGYSFTRATLENSPTNIDHNVTLSLAHQFTPRDSGQARYSLDVFESSGGSQAGTTTTTGSDTQVSNALTLGWSRQLTPSTSITLAAGPRFTGGSASPEVEARIDHQFKFLETQGRAFLSYARSESVVIGQAGPSKTETYSGGVGFEPMRNLSVSIGGAITKLSATSSSSAASSTTSGDTTTYSVLAGASYQILRWLVARASYGYGFQQQDIGDIRRNVVSVSLEVLYPYRVDQ